MRGRPPFDGTNAPDTWRGRGTAVTPRPDLLVYTDDSGILVEFVPSDAVPDPLCL